MPEYRLRQWILSLVTTPEHAATIVGDMVEEQGSTLHCWIAIASHLAHALTPGLIRGAIGGFVAQFLLSMALAFAVSPLLPLLTRRLNVFHWFFVVAFTGTQIATGYWIAHWRHSRTLLLVLIVMLLDCTAGALNLNNASVNMAIWSIPLLAGTLLYRRMSLRFTFLV
jgi:hypothetical protein